MPPFLRAPRTPIIFPVPDLAFDNLGLVVRRCSTGGLRLKFNQDTGAAHLGHSVGFWDSAHQRKVMVKGIHFVEQDSPREIGRALAAWYKSL